MREIEIEMEGLTVAARLLDDEAPKTCQLLWGDLPYEDLFTHAQWSSLMIHSNKHPRMDIDVSRYPLVENPCAFLAPGDIIIWPINGQVAIAYGSAEFRWLTGPWVVTKVATIEGDLAEFAKRCDRMMWKGAKRVVIRQKDQKKGNGKRTSNREKRK